MKIKETKCTCKACGHIWYFGKEELLEHTGATMQNLGTDLMCCSGCLPALFIPEKKVADPTKCPLCGSKAAQREEVIHDV